MSRSHWALAVVAVFALGSAAAAQDFGVDWMDRVTRELEKDRPPLTRPAELKFWAGERVYWDSNVFLEDENEDSDTIFVTYGRARLDYGETNFEASLDVLANYNYYLHEEDARDHEERVYGRVRYEDGVLGIELAEIFRRQSDPFDRGISTVLPERVERIVSDTFGGITVRPSQVIGFGANGQVQVVRMDDEIFEGLDNVNYRVGGTFSYVLPSGVEILANAGYLAIDYDNEPDDPTTPGAPDVKGYYARGGWRGEIQQRVTISVLVGVTSVRSESFSALGIKSDSLTTADVEAHIRFEATEKTAIFADVSRRAGFGFGDSFEIITRVIGGVEYEFREGLKFIARGQYDYVHGQNGLNRDFGSAHGGFTYQLHENILLDAGFTWRTGRVVEGAFDDELYDDFIVSGGAAFTF